MNTAFAKQNKVKNKPNGSLTLHRFFGETVTSVWWIIIRSSQRNKPKGWEYYEQNK